MRYHVLGVGSIGSLIAFHLKRSLKLQRNALLPGSSSRTELLLSNLSNKRPNSAQGSIVSSLNIPPYVHSQLPDPRQASVTLHLRKRLFAKHGKTRQNNSIIVEQNGIRDVEGGFQTDQSAGATEVVASVVTDLPGENIEAESDFDEEGDRQSNRFSISRGKQRSSDGRENALTSRSAIPDQDGGVSLISSIEGVYTAPRASPIDSLIVTTKCDATLAAIESLQHRIHPWSTIVLLQNGLGVLDTLNERIFQDPESRPNFILATTTHGCFRKGPLETVHAATGSLHFSVVPSTRSGSDGFEKYRVLNKNAIMPAPPISMPSLTPRDTIGKGWEKFAPDVSSPESKPAMDPEAPSDLLSISSISDQPNVRTLRATVASLLAMPLDVHWEPIADFQIRMLRKLVINACINPLTALADCKNGELFGNPAAMDAIWNICSEASLVLEAQVRDYLQQQEQHDEETGRPRATRVSTLSTADLLIRSAEDGKPVLNPALTPKALFKEVQRVARLTAANWSSMHADIKARRGATEIDFINGYISALGRGYGITTTANDMLTSMIKLKTHRMTGSSSL